MEKNNERNEVLGAIVAREITNLFGGKRICRPFIAHTKSGFEIGFRTVSGQISAIGTGMIPDGATDFCQQDLNVTTNSIWRALKLLEALPVVNFQTLDLCALLSFDFELTDEMRTDILSALLMNFIGVGAFLSYRNQLLQQKPKKEELAEIRKAFAGKIP